MIRRAAAILIALGGILYAAWFLQWVVPTDLRATSSYISELSATNQPNHWLFRMTDLLSGLSLVLGSFAAMISTPRSRWMLTGWASLLLFGASTIADSLTPLACAATANESCERLTELGELGAADSLHAFTSGGEDLFFVLTMVSLIIVAYRVGVSRFLRRAAVATAVAIVLAWGLSTASAAEFQLVGANDALGIWQRVQVFLMGVWLVLVSCELLRVRRVARISSPDAHVDIH